jgi:hypothetical protein
MQHFRVFTVVHHTWALGHTLKYLLAIQRALSTSIIGKLLLLPRFKNLFLTAFIQPQLACHRWEFQDQVLLLRNFHNSTRQRQTH